MLLSCWIFLFSFVFFLFCSVDENVLDKCKKKNRFLEFRTKFYGGLYWTLNLNLWISKYWSMSGRSIAAFTSHCGWLFFLIIILEWYRCFHRDVKTFDYFVCWTFHVHKHIDEYEPNKTRTKTTKLRLQKELLLLSMGGSMSITSV